MYQKPINLEFTLNNKSKLDIQKMYKFLFYKNFFAKVDFLGDFSKIKKIKT